MIHLNAKLFYCEVAINHGKEVFILTSSFQFHTGIIKTLGSVVPTGTFVRG